MSRVFSQPAIPQRVKLCSFRCNFGTNKTCLSGNLVMLLRVDHSPWCAGCSRGYSLGERLMAYTSNDLTRLVLAEVSQRKAAEVIRTVITPAYITTRLSGMAITRIKEHGWRILAGTRSDQFAKMKALSDLMTAKVRHTHDCSTPCMCKPNYA